MASSLRLFLLPPLAAVAACSTLHLSARRVAPSEMPPVSHPDALVVHAGHAIHVPAEAPKNRVELLGPAAQNAFDDFIDGFARSLPEDAPAWVAHGTLDEETRKVADVVARLGNGEPAPDPLVDIKLRKLSGVTGVRSGDCPGGGGPQCVVVKLDDHQPERLSDVHWVRLRIATAGAKTRSSGAEKILYRRLLGWKHEPDDILSIDGELLPAGTHVSIDVAQAAELSRPALSFVHIAAIAFRGASARVSRPAASAALARHVASLARSSEAGTESQFALDALVAIINGEIELGKAARKGGYGGRLAPALVLHTGSLVDVGLASELERAHAIVDRLRVPWFNALGPHDTRPFGRFFPGECLTTASLSATAKTELGAGSICLDQSIGCAGPGACDESWLATRSSPAARFIALHQHTTPQELPQLAGAATENHGFDRNQNAGYYALTTPLDLGDGSARKAVFVMLDTTDGATSPDAGALSPGQLAWLRGVLKTDEGGKKRSEKDLIFVLGHHPIADVAEGGGRADLVAALAGCPSVVAYLGGSVEGRTVAAARPHPVGRGGGFWEIDTASAGSFPGRARLLTLKTLGGGLAFLESVQFGAEVQGASPYAEHVRTALAAAASAACAEGYPCSDGKPEDREPPSARLFFRLPGAE